MILLTSYSFGKDDVKKRKRENQVTTRAAHSLGMEDVGAGECLKRVPPLVTVALLAHPTDQLHLLRQARCKTHLKAVILIVVEDAIELSQAKVG